MNKDFGGVIWTNHALQKLKERGIKQGDAWATWRRPDQSRFANNKEAWIYNKTWGDTKIEVVAKKNEKGQWIILSVWSKKVNDKQKKEEEQKKDSIWKKILWAIIDK